MKQQLKNISTLVFKQPFFDPLWDRFVETETGRINVATASLAQARTYAEKEFVKAGKNFDKILPDFDKNYQALQKACKASINVSRKEMPVIEPDDMVRFVKDVDSGRVDIFAPYAKGHLYAPTGLSGKEKDEWITLGFKDGSLPDDQIRAPLKYVEAKNLKPTQSQIWLDIIISSILKFGMPGPAITKKTIMTSKEGMILDGHHRYGQAMIAAPDLKFRTLFVPIDIRTLLKVGRTYGEYLGHSQRT